MGAAIWAIVSQRSARGPYRMSDATSTGGEGNTALCRMFDLSHTPANWRVVGMLVNLPEWGGGGR